MSESEVLLQKFEITAWAACDAVTGVYRLSRLLILFALLAGHKSYVTI